MTRRERSWILAFAGVALVLRIPIAFWSPAHIAQILGDDAFYLFSIARNLAAGLGPSVDGHHLTNGFQPLVTLLYTPIFWLSGSDSWLAVRWTIVLNGLIAAASVIAAAGVAHALACVNSRALTRFSPAIIAAFLWTFSISLFYQTTNGLETGLYSLLLLAVMWWKIERPNSPAIFGVLLGLAVLARIDAAIFAAIVLAFEIWPSVGARRRYKTALVAGAVALLISSPWWIYNLVYFGSIMPTSGQAGQIWPSQIADSISRLIQTLDNITLVIGYIPDGFDLLQRLIVGILLSITICVTVRGTGIAAKLKSSASTLAPLAIFSGILVIYYTFFFHFPHFIVRYLQPLRVLWLIIVSITLPRLIEAYANLSPTRRRVTAIFAFTCLLLSVAFAANRYMALYDKTERPEFYDMGAWAAEHPSDKIGMLQSGLTSFLAPNIINLDGKVNAEALRAHQEGHLARYIRNEQILYIADWKPFIEDVAEMCRKDELFFDSVGMVGHIQIMRRRVRSLPATTLGMISPRSVN